METNQTTQKVKRKPGRPKGSTVKKRESKNIDRPLLVQSDGKRVMVPDALPPQPTQEELVRFVRQQDKVVLLLHSSLAKYREMFRAEKLMKAISTNAVTALAAVGHDKRQIARALGFSESTWRARADLVAAYDDGRSSLEGALLSKQVEMALDGNDKLIVWLGKVMLGQQDTPTTAIQINNTSGSSAVSIKQKMSEAREKAITQFNDTKDVIDADLVEPGKDE